MPYDKQNWLNGPVGETPLEALRLNHMEDGIEQVEIETRAYAEDQASAAETDSKAYTDEVSETTLVLAQNNAYDLVASTEESLINYIDTLVVGVPEAIDAKVARALRTFHVALASISTTAVDVLVGPSDSIGEGVGAGSWATAWVRVLQDRLRRAMQPPGIKGGWGYSGIGSPTFLAGQPWAATSGSVALDYTKGLGLKSAILSTGATYTAVFTGTRLDLHFRKVSGGGSFTVAVDGGAASPAQSAAGSGLGTYTVSGLSDAVHTVAVTATAGPVTLTGGMFYNGDQASGLRVWEAGHSGYTAQHYIVEQGWVDDLAIIPNPKLIVLPIGSNDFYFGVSVATLKTRIETLIGLIRTKLGTSPSIALVSYYDRPAPGAVAPWSDYVAMYREIAESDDDIMHIDLGSTFGPLESDTDSRGGLTTAVPGDYVHPTTAGHRVLGEKVASSIIPSGGASAGVESRVTPTDVKLAEGDGASYLNLGSYSGGLSFAVVGVVNLALTATGSVTLSAAGLPTIPSGRTASLSILFRQDATGGRSFTMGGINFAGTTHPLVDVRPNTYSLFRFYYDGAAWWCIPVHTWDVQAAVSGTATNSIASIAGAMSFANFSPLNGYTYRATLTGNVTLATSGMPPTVAGRSSRFFIKFTQDATGGRTLTHGPGFLYHGSVEPVINPTASKSSLFEYFYDGAAWWVTAKAIE